MPRFAYFVVLGLGVLVLWIWQSERGQDMARDTLSPGTTDTPESESEVKRPLTPEERSAYIATVKRALREGLVVYKGRLRMFSDDWRDEPVYVPIPLISVQCYSYFEGVKLLGPGAEVMGESFSTAPPSWRLTKLFSTDIDRALHETVEKASDGTEVLEEVCRMVIDELDRI